MTMTLDEAIKHAEEVAEEQESNAHMYKDMMMFKQNIKHNIAAKLHEESMNECIECAEEHRQLAEWLRELKKLREQTRWIPMSERSPEGEEIVLMTIDSSYFPKPYVDMGFYKMETKKCYWFNTEDIDSSIKVTAWMHMPESYKSESGNKE